MMVAGGDFITSEVLEYLNSFGKEVHAVFGNMDEPLLKETLPETLELKIEGLKIGIYHGNGPPQGIEERVKAKFKDIMDAYIFGHTHYPISEVIEHSLYFNPGTVTGYKASLGFLYIEFKKIYGEIIYLN